MFIAAMIVIGLAMGGLLGLVGLGLYISIMEPASLGEQEWQQGETLTERADGDVKSGQRSGMRDLDRKGSLTRVPHA